MSGIWSSFEALWNIIVFTFEGLASFISQLIQGIRYTFDIVERIMPETLLPYALSALFIMFTLQILGRSGG